MLSEKELLPQYSNDKIKVYKVNQEFIHNDHMPDFVGGHALIMDFIPPGEIWLADDLDDNQTKSTLYYLLVQKRLMAKGVPYKDSIKMAGKLEKEVGNDFEGDIQNELNESQDIIEPSFSNGAKHNLAGKNSKRLNYNIKSLHENQKKRRHKLYSHKQTIGETMVRFLG